MHSNEVDFTQLTPNEVSDFVEEVSVFYSKAHLYALKDQLKRQGVSILKKDK